MTKNNFPLLTIITPSFNQAKFIQQTIESVFDQKYLPLQYWVVDGKSSDGTIKILEKFGQNLQYVSQKDGGQTDALNHGLQLGKVSEKAEGIFAYINSDDYYLPGAFEQVAAAFAAHPEKMWLVGDAMIVNENGGEIQKPIRWYKRNLRSCLSFFLLKILNPIPQPAVFIRSKALAEIGPFNQQLHYVMDYEYWLRLWQKYGSPIMVKDSLAAFRIHGQSKGTTAFTKQFAEELQVAQKFSQNWLALLLHRLHNQLILTSYRQMKKETQ